VVQVRAVFDERDHIASGVDSQFKRPLSSEPASREAFRDLSPVRELDLRLPGSPRLPLAPKEMNARNAARVVGSLLLVEFPEGQHPCRSDLAIAPADRGAQGLLRASVLRLVEPPVVKPAAPPEMHRPVPRSPVGLEMLDRVHLALGRFYRQCCSRSSLGSSLLAARRASASASSRPSISDRQSGGITATQNMLT